MKKLIKQAFTLIELLVVIAIIGILSSLIVVSMSGIAQKANIAKSQIFSNSLKNSLLLNLVSEWRLDENTGGTTSDSWSGGSTGTLVGPTHLPTWTNSDCVDGSCLQFDGIDDYVNFGNKSSLSMKLGDATVSFWVKFNNDTAPQRESLIVCGGVGSGVGYGGYWIARWSGTGQLWGTFSDGSATYLSDNLSSSTSLKGNTWYNIVVVYTRASSVQAYINGAKQTGYSLAISAQPGSVQNWMNFEAGSYDVGTSLHHLVGKMDDIHIYNAATTISQIKEQYYIGLNNLLINGGIDSKEYLSRINQMAINE